MLKQVVCVQVALQTCILLRPLALQAAYENFEAAAGEYAGGQGDADGDGVPDYADNDNDNDGVPDYADNDNDNDNFDNDNDNDNGGDDGGFDDEGGFDDDMGGGDE